MTTVIKAENISKQYRLGYVGSGSIKDDVKRWWYGIRGKEDPLLTVGESNDRTRKGESDYVWALKDINFEIQQGDTVGIIGRNGAGKSTLLKLLSKVTAPTTGNIKVKGRIASLLEVGTGFHGELTGRENIYLNGAIMGMRKHEIARRLDEIVDFAGVERYLDTPVKRYSSGMYVRLGFAVAAHLDNEILIVDEVLAVGDAEFQKKCLGKMGDVSTGEGRTVLFVSHNMNSVAQICKNGIFLHNGKVEKMDEMKSIIAAYNQFYLQKKQEMIFPTRLMFYGQINQFTVKQINQDIHRVDISFELYKYIKDFRIGVKVYDEYGKDVIRSLIADNKEHSKDLEKGIYNVYCSLNLNLLTKGTYRIALHCSIYSEMDFLLEETYFYEINKEYPADYNPYYPLEKKSATIILNNKWQGY
jgi:lipopolysaccharide transport system ATP-binding protein